MSTDDAGPPASLEIRFGQRGRTLTVPDAWITHGRSALRVIGREPFSKRPWRELGYFLVSGALGGAGLALVAATFVAGTALLVTVVGVAVIGLSVRLARGSGRWHRSLARRMGIEDVAEPEPFVPGHGFFGWVQSALRDRVGWRAMAYGVLKAPLWALGFWFALSVWYDAAICLLHPIRFLAPSPSHVFGFVRSLFPPGYFSVGYGFVHGAFVFVTGILLLFVAPWTMRLVIMADRWLLRGLLSPDPVAARVRTLESARSQTIDASAATLRRIERDLHDGTQAQLVALAMQLGQAKEKLAVGGGTDLESARRLIDDAPRAPRTPSPSFGTLSGGSILRSSIPGLRVPFRRWWPVAAFRPGWTSRSPTALLRRSRPSPTSAPRSCWPTWSSTPGHRVPW